ncbi:hypothetical protein [Burkholderia diffusa]|uniref:hypothetical protein n=1 Tax=Burkholderia diffusa TaxID=488732 RepID=UPI0018C8BCEB|nr:hypothetical protein [Burkholderia diffusa]
MTVSRRAWQACTRRNAASQFFSSCAAIRAVLRITGGIAPLSQRGLVPGLLQFKLHDSPLLVQGIHVHLLGLLGRFNRQWLHDAQKLLADSGIDA